MFNRESHMATPQRVCKPTALIYLLLHSHSVPAAQPLQVTVPVEHV